MARMRVLKDQRTTDNQNGVRPQKNWGCPGTFGQPHIVREVLEPGIDYFPRMVEKNIFQKLTSRLVEFEVLPRWVVSPL